ncbi:XAC2610-related protein [Flavobacterium sp. MMS24-S5]|uniref:XAC2610-related protein n=1 Tax=Flavobacterium sp. MMS24-S5 TaxID=3416605 RepID=UPI003D06F70D
MMEIKVIRSKFFYVLCIMLFVISCKRDIQKKEESSISQKDINGTEQIQENDSLIINTIKEFYISYIFENSKNEINSNIINKIKDKYISKKLIQNIRNQMENGSLDWDPFVNAQDFYDGWIKTLKVKKDESVNNQYIVSYYNGKEDEKICLGVIKEKNQYKIDFIIRHDNKIIAQENLQECFYKNLLKDKTIHIIKSEIVNSQNLKITLIDSKSNIIFQELNYTPFNFDFNCKSIVFTNDIPLHNDYEIIVGDYNFDSLDDFAIVYDNSINTGTIYTYFFQNSEGFFEENKLFPVRLIPSKINKIDKTLEQVSIVGCCKINTIIYQLTDGNKWVMISSKQENITN